MKVTIDLTKEEVDALICRNCDECSCNYLEINCDTKAKTGKNKIEMALKTAIMEFTKILDGFFQCKGCNNLST